MWLKNIFLVTPSAAVQCWFQLQRFLLLFSKSDTADVHVQKVADWRRISASFNLISETLNYPFKTFSEK